jgi:hypothetical protein
MAALKPVTVSSLCFQTSTKHFDGSKVFRRLFDDWVFLHIWKTKALASYLDRQANGVRKLRQVNFHLPIT